MYDLETMFHKCVIVMFKSSDHIYDQLSDSLSNDEKSTFVENVRNNYSKVEFYKILAEYFEDSFNSTID